LQFGAFLLPVALLTISQGFPVKETFSLRRPAGRSVLGSVLVGVSANVALAGVILRLLPPPDSVVEGMQRLLLFGDTPGSLLVAWGVLAFTPALCEEALFRGLILSSFRRLGTWPAIVFSALLFGLAHASIYRLLPTFGLGLVFGYAVCRTRSIFCSMLMHALNNGLIATLVWWQSGKPGVALDELSMVPWSWTLAAVGVATVGLSLLQPPLKDDLRAG
jgi:sodium transport system permease protein